MGERAVQIGRKLEGFGEKLFEHFTWDELCRDREIKCTRSAHKKKTHGIDMLCKFKTPYRIDMQGIIIECKNRQMQSITQAEIEKWVKELINCIECAQSTPELSDIDLAASTLNTGLLLTHATDKFEADKFYKYLKSLNFPNRRNPINIFIAGNDKINQWTSLLAKIDTTYMEGFSFLYPSINGFNRKTSSVLTIEALYSKYLLATRTYTTQSTSQGIPYNVPHSQNIMFIFDAISRDTFKYAWSMFKYYQLQGCDEYVFVFYPRRNGDIDYIKDYFLKTIKAGKEPISGEDSEKIKLDFIDNRDLSVVETGGHL